ncbi:hydrolase [Thiospirochaeta perfilievii]|uniref:phosphoglycolate phosphatase n=1 Tax=Thiospirochaeta perfilievii TaxID=252967 RepID=A0A5C1QCK2_9SPIO|nr:HAD hydrolase-like protein [Thiospirochaeta perfilievii]QEN04659.1 hydrolase [Thiospirochaeta perfilievii]
MKYKCLILDHDDTAVHSTADIHYPAHLETMEVLRPGQKVISLDEWFLKNFHPGIMEYMKGELGFSQEEIMEEYKIWQDYVETRHPEFYPGFLDIIRDFKKKGGRIAVVSHSNKDIIKRDYERAGAGDIPEMIFGWDIDESKRKPAPFPVEEILKEFDLKSEECLIIDDLKPAVIMGQSTGVHVAGAGWGHQIPEIVDYMKENCHYYFKELSEFRKLILD